MRWRGWLAMSGRPVWRRRAQERAASVGWWARRWCALTDGFRRWAAQQRSEQIRDGGWGMQAVHTEHYCSGPVVKGPERQSGTPRIVSAGGWNAATYFQFQILFLVCFYSVTEVKWLRLSIRNVYQWVTFKHTVNANEFFFIYLCTPGIMLIMYHACITFEGRL